MKLQNTQYNREVLRNNGFKINRDFEIIGDYIYINSYSLDKFKKIQDQFMVYQSKMKTNKKDKVETKESFQDNLTEAVGQYFFIADNSKFGQIENAVGNKNGDLFNIAKIEKSLGGLKLSPYSRFDFEKIEQWLKKQNIKYTLKKRNSKESFQDSLYNLTEAQKKVGDTLYYKDGNEAGVVKEVTKTGYVVEPKNGGDWFYVQSSDTKSGSESKESYQENLANLAKNFSEIDKDMVRELAFFGLNTYEIYKQVLQPTIKNYAKKIKKGNFDKKRAIEGIANNVFPVVKKKYEKEFGTSLGRIDKQTKLAFAEEILEGLMDEIEDQ